jgi:hypothetical protein
MAVTVPTGMDVAGAVPDNAVFVVICPKLGVYILASECIFSNQGGNRAKSRHVH